MINFLTFWGGPNGDYQSEEVCLKNDIKVAYLIHKAEEDTYEVTRLSLTAGLSVKRFYGHESARSLKEAMLLAEIDLYLLLPVKLYDWDCKLDGRISALIHHISRITKIFIQKEIRDEGISSEEEFDYSLVKETLIDMLRLAVEKDDSVLNKLIRREKKATNAMTMDAIDLLDGIIDKERSNKEIVYELSKITTSLATEIYYR